MRRSDVIQYGAAIVILGLASMGQRCDPNRACPTGMQPAPGIGLEEILQAVKSGNPTNTELCECREGYEPNGTTWIQGCHPSETPTTVTTLSTPTPTPVPTPKPTPTPTPISTPTPPVPGPTSEPSPEPTPCVRSVDCTAAGVAEPGTDRSKHFDSFRAACDARVAADIRKPNGRGWCDPNGQGWCVYDNGTAVNMETCEVHRSPGGPAFRTAKRFGVSCVAGEPCPDPPPVETPTPLPVPTPTPGECGTLEWKVVGLCTNRKPCTCNGMDWGRPLCVRVADAPTHVLYTAVAMIDGRDVHKGDACWPGPIPTFRDGHHEGHAPSGWFVTDPSGAVIVSEKDHRGAALAEAVTQHGAVPSWQERVISGDHLDYGWALSEGYNTTGRDHDFRAEIELCVQAHGATGCIRISVR